MGALIAVYALLVLGLLLCFVGRFPGQVLAYAGMLVAAFALHNHDYPVWMLILCGVLVVGSILVNILVAPKLAAKVHEFGKAGKWGTIVGSIISLFCIAATENKVVALIIFILLPFLFAFLFEWISRKKAGEGAKRAVGAYTLFAGTTFINLLVAAFISIEVFYGWDNFISGIKSVNRTESRRDRKDAGRDWDDEDEDEARDRREEKDEDMFEVSEAIEDASKVPSHARLNGTLRTSSGKSYPITMVLNFVTPGSGGNTADVDGYYFYQSKSEDNNIKLSGTLFNDHTMTLRSQGGTETFQGLFMDNTAFNGTWTMSKDGKVTAMAFGLAGDDFSAFDDERMPPDRVEEVAEEAVETVAGSADDDKVAKMIDQYEKLINRFIAIQKAEDSFDFELYEQASELENQIDELIDSCSDRLQDRFEELSLKFSKAAMFGSR